MINIYANRTLEGDEEAGHHLAWTLPWEAFQAAKKKQSKLPGVLPKGCGPCIWEAEVRGS